jgi:hypothetical protein
MKRFVENKIASIGLESLFVLKYSEASDLGHTQSPRKDQEVEKRDNPLHRA